jgi:hypothetical protein
MEAGPLTSTPYTRWFSDECDSVVPRSRPPVVRTQIVRQRSGGPRPVAAESTANAKLSVNVGKHTGSELSRSTKPWAPRTGESRSRGTVLTEQLLVPLVKRGPVNHPEN